MSHALTPSPCALARTTLAIAASLPLTAALASAALPQTETPPNVNIDVLAVYTPGAAALYSGGVRTRVQHVLNVANRAYADSGVGITLRLASAIQVAYGDTPTSSTALTTIKNNSTPFQSVESWRTKYGADMVVLLRKYNGDGYAGLGYVGGIGTRGDLSAYRRYMYSNVAINTADYVLSHELGHNMGLVHSRRQDPAGGTFHYSAGHGVQSTLVDIMAYGSVFGVGDAQKVYQFSNPERTHNGVALGVVRTNTSAGADAAASLNHVRETIAGFATSRQFVASSLGDFGGDERADLFRWDPDTGATYTWVTGVAAAPESGLGAVFEASLEPNAQLLASGDFDGDGTSDVLIRQGDGQRVEAWLLGSGAAEVVECPTMYGAYWTVAGAGDLDADGRDDVVWRNTWNGVNQVWRMQAAGVPAVATLETLTPVAWRIDAVGDFDADGKQDLFWRHGTTGANQIWFMNGAAVRTRTNTLSVADLAVRGVGAGDLDGDGDDDLVLQHGTTGAVSLWTMNGATAVSRVTLRERTTLRLIGVGDLDGDGLDDDLVWNDAAAEEDVVWTLASGVVTSQRSLKSGRDLLDDVHAAGDFDGDGKGDLLWRNTGSGANTVWRMDGAEVIEVASTTPLVTTTPQLTRSGDFDGDGKGDVLWIDTASRQLRVWLMDGATVKANHLVGALASGNVGVVAIGDLTGDGRDDLVLRNGATGGNQLLVPGLGAASALATLPALTDVTWSVVGAADFNGDGRDDLLWRNPSTGRNSVWLMNGAARIGSVAMTVLTDSRWRVQGVGDVDGDGAPDLVWRHVGDGRNTVWFLQGTTVLPTSGATTSLPDVAWRIEDLADFDGDGRADLLFEHTATRERRLWLMNGRTVTANTAVN